MGHLIYCKLFVFSLGSSCGPRDHLKMWVRNAVCTCCMICHTARGSWSACDAHRDHLSNVGGCAALAHDHVGVVGQLLLGQWRSCHDACTQPRARSHAATGSQGHCTKLSQSHRKHCMGHQSCVECDACARAVWQSCQFCSAHMRVSETTEATSSSSGPIMQRCKLTCTQQHLHGHQQGAL